MLRVIAPAKVNLFLGIGPVMPDGYHALVSVFHSLELADEVTIRPAASLSLRVSHSLDLPAEENLAHRAAVSFGEAVGNEPRVAIELTKRIPHGAGMGGGSSDAAAVIVGLAALWGIDRSDRRCWDVATSLGADVPFFLTAGAALMIGRGDVLSRELPTLGGAPAVLVRPELPVPTALAYRAFDAHPVPAGRPDAVIEGLEAGDPRLVAVGMGNNLEQAASVVVPDVAEALAWVRVCRGVSGAIVAGSGSAVFALCESAADASRIAHAARVRGWWSEPTALGSHAAVASEE